MNTTYASKTAAERAGDTYRKSAAQFDEIARDTPKAMQAVAEKSIAQTRELFEHSKGALEVVLDSWEKSFDAVNQGAVALNHKIIDITQRNINSGFDLAKSLAGAKNLAEATELQAAYWRRQVGALTAQAEEVRKLSNSDHCRRSRADQIAGDARDGMKPALTHLRSRKGGAGRSRRPSAFLSKLERSLVETLRGLAALSLHGCCVKPTRVRTWDIGA